jgi:hypothetical protein
LEGGKYNYPADNWRKDSLHFTASLDAALSLVPEGMEALIDSLGRASVYLNESKDGELAVASTAALALCAAALRARARFRAIPPHYLGSTECSTPKENLMTNEQIQKVLDNDYDVRSEETLLKRLLRRLADRGLLSDYDLIELAYPSMEAIEAAEAGEVL